MSKTDNQFYSEIGKKTNQVMMLIFALAIVFILVIAGTGERTVSEPSLKDMSWNEGWIMPDGTELSLPCADKVNDSITIRKTLPQGLTEQDSLVFSSGYQPVQVLVDGESLPVTGTFEGRIVYATAYSHVALKPEMSGKEIQVTFWNQGGKQWMELYSIKLGNFNLIRQAAFSEDSISVISSTVLLAFSVLIFFIGLLQRKSVIQVMNNHTQNFLLASIVSTMFSIWMLVDTETVTLLFGGNPAYVFVNIFSFLFIMGPWLMQIILSNNKQSLVLRILAMSGLIETAMIMIGVILGFFSFSAYLTAAHLIGVGVEGAILYLSFESFRQRRDMGSKLLFGAGILLVVMSCIAAYTYYYAVSPNNVSYMKYGIFGYIVVMLYDLFSTFDKINRTYVKEVETARLAAVKANQAKSDFLSSMSHDIRTPMNAIMGLTTIASANIDNKDVVRDSLQKITLSSRHLLGLINDILDMSKIESGKISLTIEELSLRELMENLVNIIQPQIKSRRQKFEIILENIICEHVYCDGVRLNQILLNLLSNAVKFTEEEGFICVTLRQEDSPKGDQWVRTSFCVKDNGIGMSQEFIEHIFDSFTRADNVHVRSIEGSGLGMSITKHIVDMMDGTIIVDSYLGEGSTFLVTLDMERGIQQDVTQVMSEREEISDLTGRRILVAEDNDINWEIDREILSSNGFLVERAEDGLECLHMFETSEPGYYDIILMDIRMPRMDGYESTMAIRALQRPDASIIPIVAMTADAFNEDVQHCMSSGMNGHIAKPLDFKALLRLIRSHIEKKDC